MSEEFKKEFARAQAKAKAEAEAHDKMNQAKDLILEHMAGCYFRAEQARDVMGQDITVAELVNRMPPKSQVVMALKYAWTQDYMVEAFYTVMKEDGETIDPAVIGNLSAIEAPNTAPIVKY